MPWPVLRRTLALAGVFALAKVCVVAARIADGHARALRSAWMPAVFFYQDAWALAAFLAVDLGLAFVCVRSARSARALRVETWGAWAVYAVASAYVAINVPVARVFGTPFTWSILAGAGGALTDSIVVYLTPVNVVSVVAVAVGAVLFAAFVRLVPRTLVVVAGALAALAAALGPIGFRRMEVLGVHRNAIVTLVRTAWAQRVAFIDPSVRASPIEAEGTALDLTHLARVGAGRNVVWVVLESTGASYLRPYGAMDDPTPNLTAFVSRAVVFEHVYAAYPESIKGLYAMLCSFAPAPHTAADRYDAARLPCRSVAENFAGAGYRTAFFHSGRFIYLGMEHIVRGRGFERLDDAGEIGGKFESSFGVDDASTARRVLAWVDSLRPGERFFAIYSPISGHHPYETPGEGRRPFGEDTDFHRYESDLYRGDLAFGMLVEGLRARGLLDSTVWAIHGDHGEAFFQHEGNFAHTLFVYEENVRVPFFLVIPGLEREVRAPQVASLVDVAPTLLDLAGYAPPAEWQGRSLLAPTARIARFFTDHALWHVGLRDGRWKFIHTVDNGRSTLFDLSADPEETTDLSPRFSDRAARYRDHLLAWQSEQRALVDR